MYLKLGLCIIFMHLTSVFSTPQPITEGLVVVTQSTTEESRNKEDTSSQDATPKIPRIYSMRVDTNVTNRFATTLVTSKIKNLADSSHEVTFAVVLPESAYISGFTMEIDGKKYEAYVQEKEEAKKTYNKAVASGLGAGHVAVSARDSNRFTVSVNIEPQSKATFYLKYEQLLKREKGQYDIVLNLHPGQPVQDLEVQVNINETRPLSFVKIPSLRTGNEISKNEEKLDPKADIERIAKNTAKVIFKPDIERQKELGLNLGAKEGDGLAGQFVVQYDVERDPEGGEILVSDGYFVHFFAPTELKPLPKHVVFVLDTSGSMYGQKMEQLQQAMKKILHQLYKEDCFNIIEFNTVVKVWNIPETEVQFQLGSERSWGAPTTPKPNISEHGLPSSFQVSAQNIKKAKEVVDRFRAYGGTNIGSAFEVCLRVLKQNKSKDERQPIIIFLTDGQPTIGITNTDNIISKVMKENIDEVPIFSLSFGSAADRSFLEKLSLKNQGFARHIYEAADAALQLESFYKYIASPLLTKANFKYVSNSVSEVTKTNFPILFDGAEFVVAGKYPIPRIKPTVLPEVIDPGIAPQVTCLIGTRRTEFKPTYSRSLGSLEKHWAYLTLKQVLEQRDAADNKTELTKKALNIALHYSFVTPVSSLVVVKPNGTNSKTNLEDASKGGLSFESPRQYLPSPRGPIGPPGIYNIRTYGFRPPARKWIASTVRPTLRTTELPKPLYIQTFEKLVKELPWLKNIFNAGNGTLSLPQGQYLLDSTSTITNAPVCPKTPNNTTGVCVLLKECPTVHNLLIDLPTYSQYFCPLNGCAGICCAEASVKSVQTKL